MSLYFLSFYFLLSFFFFLMILHISHTRQYLSLSGYMPVNFIHVVANGSISFFKAVMATHSSVLAWRIPGTAEPGGLPSMGSHRVGHD